MMFSSTELVINPQYFIHEVKSLKHRDIFRFQWNVF